MRRTYLLPLALCGFAAIWALPPSPARGEPTFPYRAYVTTDDVYIRSGPGKSYYPTDKTKSGQLVEVYRHDPGGWCAIRPPEGSFTWVSTRFIEPTGDGLARVTSTSVAARVGSRFSEIRDVVQVRLHQDEMVELLDGRQRSENAWVRIAPPSGEFRWIHSKYLDPEYPVDGIRKNTEDAADGQPPEPAPTTAWNAEKQTPPERRRSTEPHRLAPEEYQKRLDGLDLELSVMVAEEPTVWHFDELALDAEHLIAQAETALERGRARMLLSKIERFENIKQRYDAVEGVIADVQRRDRRLTALADRRDSTGDPASLDRFDGRGRLTRVVSPKPGSPRYALVDSSGRVTCYVTPTPGMSLRHYEQRVIGVSGTRGYMPEQKAYHVLAEHIDLLGEGRLR